MSAADDLLDNPWCVWVNGALVAVTTRATALRLLGIYGADGLAEAEPLRVEVDA